MAAQDQFMQQVQQTMQRMLHAFTNFQKKQQQETQQQQARLAQVVSQSVNRMTADIEKREERERRQAEAEANREFQMDLMEYQQEKASEMQQQGKMLASEIEAQRTAVTQHLAKRERTMNMMRARTQAAMKRVYEWDAQGVWSELENGDELRRQMIHDAKASQATAEDMYNSPYADRLMAYMFDVEQKVIGGEEFTDISRTIAERKVAPPWMAKAKERELPEFSDAEVLDWTWGQGYPTSGVLALGDDPKRGFVNPMTRLDALEALQESVPYSLAKSRKAKESLNLGRARAEVQAGNLSRQYAGIQMSVVERLDPLALPAVMDGLSDFASNWDGSQGVSPDKFLVHSVLRHLFQDMNPKYADAALAFIDPDTDFEIKDPGDALVALHAQAGVWAVRERLNLAASEEGHQAFGPLIWDLAFSAPEALTSLGLNPDDIAALRSESKGGEEAVKQAVVTRRAVQRLIGKIGGRMNDIVHTIDQQGPIYTMRQQLGAAPRMEDRRVLMAQSVQQSAQAEQERERRLEELKVQMKGASAEEIEQMAATGGYGEEFMQSLNTIDAAIALHGETPPGMTVLDILSGGKTNLTSESYADHEAAMNEQAQLSPEFKAVVDNVEARYQRDMERTRLKAPPIDSPQTDPGGQPSQAAQLGGREEYGMAGAAVGAAMDVGGAVGQMGPSVPRQPGGATSQVHGPAVSPAGGDPTGRKFQTGVVGEKGAQAIDRFFTNWMAPATPNLTGAERESVMFPVDRGSVVR